MNEIEDDLDSELSGLDFEIETDLALEPDLLLSEVEETLELDSPEMELADTTESELESEPSDSEMN